MLRPSLLLVALLVIMSEAAAAPSATFIIEDQEVLKSDPALEAEDLRGKILWLGDIGGDAGSAKFIRKGSDADEVLLNEEFNSRLLLAYEQKSTFLPIEAVRLSDKAIQSVVKAKLTGWQNLSNLEFYELAKLDLNGDGASEVVVKVNAPRAAADPYEGYATSVEGLFIVARSGATYQVQGQILPDRGDAKDPRMNVDLLAIAQNPSTRAWEFLVKAESQQWGEGDFNMTVTINGQTQSNSSQSTRSYQTLVDVYRYVDGKLRPNPALSSHTWGTCFGSNCN